VKSKTVWGAIRGMETFSQLTYITSENKVAIFDRRIIWSPDSFKIIIKYLLLSCLLKLAINDSTVIIDEPRFKYRGLMLDTARHFIPMPILMKQIDAMAYNKLNTFHWYVKYKLNYRFLKLAL
jgi:hexosaminidase